MASINGISVKNLKTFFGHEGETIYQGNVYLGKKKIGFWSQDSHGGCCQYAFEPGISGEMIDKQIAALNPQKAIRGNDRSGKPYVIEYDLDRLLEDIVDLMDDEKAYKSAAKGGYAGILISTDGYHSVTWNLPKEYTSMSDKDLLAVMQDVLDATVKKDFFRNTTAVNKIYRSPEDFCIGQAIALNDIKSKRSGGEG